MPIVEYTNSQGEKKRFTASIAALNSEIGDKVWVAYHEKTQHSRLLSLGELFLPFTVFSLFGLVLLLILLPLQESSAITYKILKIFNTLAK